MTDKPINIHYKFKFAGGGEKEFDINLDKATLNLITPERESYPEWIALSYSQCPNCPLNESEHKNCPIAKKMVDLIDFFKTMVSFEEVDVEISTSERKYLKHVPLQKSLSSLIGIYMVVSGCPIMDKLRPMVKFHLPFATLEETKYRALTMYLMAQYLLYKKGKTPDWELKDLSKIYEDIQVVNKHFCKRLTELKVQDASLNAIVILNLFADTVSFSIDEHAMGDFEKLFKAYLD